MNTDNEASNLPENRLWQPVTRAMVFVVFGAALVYSMLRYHFSGEVAWTHFPLFILNKVTSLAAVIFVACSYLIGRVIRWHNADPKIKLVVIKFCGLMGFFLSSHPCADFASNVSHQSPWASSAMSRWPAWLAPKVPRYRQPAQFAFQVQATVLVKELGKVSRREQTHGKERMDRCEGKTHQSAEFDHDQLDLGVGNYASG